MLHKDRRFLDELFVALSCGRPAVRAAAVQTLAVLMGLLRHPSETVRQAAAQALERVADALRRCAPSKPRNRSFRPLGR